MWSARRPVVLQHFAALRYCIESRPFCWSLGQRSVLKGDGWAIVHACSFTLLSVQGVRMKLSFSRLPTLLH